MADLEEKVEPKKEAMGLLVHGVYSVGLISFGTFLESMSVLLSAEELVQYGQILDDPVEVYAIVITTGVASTVAGILTGAKGLIDYHHSLRSPQDTYD